METRMNDQPLSGQVALVTGASRRIGRATALALAADGADIVVHARASRDEIDAVAREIEALGRRALPVLADVTDEAAVVAMFGAIETRFGRLDILVNNAAIRAETPFMEMTVAAWRAVTGVIVDGAFLCAREALRPMLRNGHGRIVNIGGVSANLGAPDRAHVITAKAGLVGLTRALATEFAARGVTANFVVPGRIGGKRSASSGRGIAGSPIVGREGTPDEVAEIVRMLCRPASGFVTGQAIHVNGGMFFG
jgi:3-oxoacyl-[acyl-carrier protein] reductase